MVSQLKVGQLELLKVSRLLQYFCEDGSESHTFHASCLKKGKFVEKTKFNVNEMQSLAIGFRPDAPGVDQVSLLPGKPCIFSCH